MKLSSRILSILLVFATCLSLLTEAVLAIDEPMYMPEETPVTETETPELTPAPADVEEPAETPAQAEEPVEISDVEAAPEPSAPTEETSEPAPASEETVEPEETAPSDESEAPVDDPIGSEEPALTDIAAADGTADTVLTTPELTAIKNTSTGVQITWNASEGAVKYRVIRKTGNGAWEKIGEPITGTSFTDTTAVSGTTYCYSVRCTNAAGTAYTSGYDAEGLTITFLSAPKFSSVTNTSTGALVSWEAVPGAHKYRVYRMVPGGSWKKLADTAETTYTDSTAVSGSTYLYSVHCVNDEGTALTSAGFRSPEIIFVAAPKITLVYNRHVGVSVSWAAVDGAAQYRVLRKAEGGEWERISGLTTETTFVDTTAVSGTRYYYTVRCVDASGTSYTSGYYAGTGLTRITAPKLTAAASTANGVELTWEKVAEAGSYRILRKTEGGSWEKVADTTETTFYDVTAPASTKVYYTVRAISADGNACLSSYDDKGLSITTPAATYYNAPLKQTITALSGGTWKKVNSLWYYYVDGNPVKDGLYRIGSYNYYFNKNGVMQTGWVITSYQTADGKTHTARSYFDSSGHRKESGWGKRNSQWCYFVNGFTVVDCLYKVSGVNYLFNADGIMQTGWVKTTAPDQEGKLTSVWSYFKSSGARIESGWSKINSKWYYFVNGACLVDTEYKINGTNYLFTDSGAMFSGWKEVTYTGSDGKTHTGSRYYYSSGARCENGSYKIGSYYYYFTDSILQHGWINTADGDRLYAYETGRLRSGWWKNDGYWYYFNANGKLATGWKTISGYTYYFYKGTEANGGPKWTMATSTTIDGYKINSSGTATIPTKMKLLSEAQNHISTTPYLIVIDSVQCRLGIFKKNSSGAWEYYDYISCAPGKASTPTYKGVYSITYDRGYYFDSGNVRCFWYSTFNGNQAIHSVLYYPSGSLADGRTGYRLSHGCVRVSYSYAKWIYNNIPVGTTTVVI